LARRGDRVSNALHLIGASAYGKLEGMHCLANNSGADANQADDEICTSLFRCSSGGQPSVSAMPGQ
jgi:hypothetical protein